MDLMITIMESPGTGSILGDIAVAFDYRPGDGQRIGVQASDGYAEIYRFAGSFADHRRGNLVKYFADRLRVAIRAGELD